MTTLVKDLISRYESLSGDRQTYEKTWDLISQYVVPTRGEFLNEGRKDGNNRQNRRLFDSTATQANEMLASTLHGGLTNPSTKWFSLKAVDNELNNSEAVKRFFEDAVLKMMRVFNSPHSNFASQNHELFMDLVAYGTGAMFVEEDPEQGIKFIARHLSEIYVAEDKNGRIDTVFRKFKLTARQAVQMWGEDLDAKFREHAEKKPEEKFEYLHVIMPRKEVRKGSKKVRNLPIASYFIDLKNNKLIREGGYNEMPWSIPRWSKLVGEVYGRSPAWSALPDIRMINVMSETMIKADQKQADPPMLMADDGVLLPLRLQPGGINYGGMDPNGRPRLAPLQTGARLNVGYESMEQRRKTIRDAFFVDQLIFREGPQMTATEVLQRQEEKLRLIGPQLGRIQTEYLSPVIDRVFSILLRNGELGEVPEELLGADTTIEYLSPLAKLQESQDALAVMKTLQQLSPLAQVDPTIMDNFNMDVLTRHLAEVNGVPLKILKLPEQVDQERQVREQQMQQVQQLQQIQQLAEVAKTGNEALKP